MPHCKCMELARKYTRRSFCLHSLLKAHGISKEIDHELHGARLLIVLIIHVWNQQGNKSGAPPAYISYQECKKSERKYTRSSTEDFCLYPSSKVCSISREIDQELHRGPLLIVLIKSVRNHKGNRPGAPEDFCLNSL